MCKLSEPKHNTSDDIDQNKSDGQITDIGALFRAHKERYIEIYHPQKHEIKFIKDVSKCKTPALGGIVISCKNCKKKTYISHVAIISVQNAKASNVYNGKTNWRARC